MQEEMTNQSIALVAKTTTVTIDVLKQLLDVYLENQRESRYAKNSKKAPKVKRGKQSVKRLLGQGQGVENIEINSDNIGLFTASARRYGVDFAMTRDKNTSPPTHTIFFKGKDTAAITSAFKDFVQREEHKVAKENRKSVLKQVRKLEQKIRRADNFLGGKEMAAEMKKAHRGELTR